jgi:hypothetical protein
MSEKDMDFNKLFKDAEKTKAYQDEMRSMARTELEGLLWDMDVSEQRFNDMGWLRRNLGIRNSHHPSFKRAMELIKGLS